MIVIIGNGIASERVLSELFKKERGDVTLIKGEPYGPYPRPRLPEYVKGSVSRSFFTEDKLAKYTQRGLSVIESRATSIDVRNKSVTLSDKKEISYDALIIATGSRARNLSLPTDGLVPHTLRTLSDADEIIATCENKRNPVVVGAGLLGLELASAIKEKCGYRVSVIESAQYLLPRQLDERSSLFFEKLLKEKGIDIIKGSAPKAYGKDSVLLEDGRDISCDALFESVGVIPDIEIAKNAGIATDRAITIDSHAMTSVKDVYAVGDAASYSGLCPGLVYFALETARVAAINADGGAEELKLMAPSAVIEVSSIPAYSIGDIRTYSDVKIHEIGNRYEALYLDGEKRLVGAVAVGSRANMLKAQKMLKKEVDLSLLDF